MNHPQPVAKPESKAVSENRPEHRPDPLQLLKKHFGYDEFRQGQRAVIDNLLQGKSAAAVFPTGGGKSLCFQLPAICLDGMTLVVSPLLALMKDQIDALQSLGINANRLDSSQSYEEYRQVVDDIRSGTLRLLYVSPERFNNERFRALLTDLKISLFAVDEAHCISEWGHNFRPDYLKLVSFAKECQAERLLALTATATHDVLADICKQFDIPAACATRTGFYRDNLQLRCTAVDVAGRDGALLKSMQTGLAGASIVYVTLQNTAQTVAQMLQENGIDARHYHAGLKDQERAEVQDWFMQSDNAVVVATIAFGMGIDKSDIRNVYHYNLPKSLENYSQEIGRAGRDGAQAVCHLFACSEDLIPLQNFVYADTPTIDSLAAFVEAVFPVDDDFDLSLYELSNQCDIKPLVLRTLLVRLELQGYLRANTPFYAGYQFKPLYSSKEILDRFDNRRSEFIARLFKQAKKNKVWFQIDLQQAAHAMDAPREQLVRALDYLAEQGLLEVKVSGLRHRYSVMKRPESKDKLANDLADDARIREQREIDRLQQLMDWITADACQNSLLCERFDQALDQACGHCNWCDEKKAVVVDTERASTVKKEIISQAISLQQDHAIVLKTTVELSRFLCGLSSPAIGRAKLTSHKLFGSCQEIPFRHVLDALESFSKTA